MLLRTTVVHSHEASLPLQRYLVVFHITKPKPLPFPLSFHFCPLTDIFFVIIQWDTLHCFCSSPLDGVGSNISFVPFLSFPSYSNAGISLSVSLAPTCKPSPTASPAWPQLPAWAKATQTWKKLQAALAEILSEITLLWGLFVPNIP